MLCFVSPIPESTDATAHHKYFPRTTRKTLRLKSTKVKPQVHDGVDSYLRTEMRVDAYFNQNLEFLDRAYDHDEFGDIDNEYEGLTITEPMTNAEMFQFCTGYDIL
jgi:hypothetical protein